jgi:RNA polymerase sigma-70 factor, ECF subfamily
MTSSAARYFPRPFGKGILSSQSDAQNSQLSSTETAAAENLGQSGSTAAAAGAAPDVAGSLDAASDETLMGYICDGDNEALACFFRRYARVVRGVCYRVLRDSSEADDMVQDVFVWVHRDCISFDSSKGSARSWILQMAYRRAISRRRYLTTRHFYTRLDLDDAGSELADPRSTPAKLDDLIDAALEHDRLHGVFIALSDDQQKTLSLFFTEGYTLDEIAAKLGQSRGNVKHHYFRGLEKLRKELFGSKLPR